MNDGIFTLAKPITNGRRGQVSLTPSCLRLGLGSAMQREPRARPALAGHPPRLQHGSDDLGLSVQIPAPATIGGLNLCRVDLAVALAATPPVLRRVVHLRAVGWMMAVSWSSRLLVSATERARYVLLDRGDAFLRWSSRSTPRRAIGLPSWLTLTSSSTVWSSPDELGGSWSWRRGESPSSPAAPMLQARRSPVLDVPSRTSPAPTVPAAASASSAVATPVPAAPSESRAIDPASPDTVRKAGGCDDFGNCRLKDVGLWQAVPFTPTIRCGLSSETCQLHFEIYAPTSDGPWPLIVLEPGGDIAPGDPGDYLDKMATALAGRGAVVIIGQWRQSSRWAGRSPDSFADIACAIGVARRTGLAFGANPDRVVLAGHSMSTRPVAVVGLTRAVFTPAPGSCDATAGSLRPDAWADLAGPRDEIAPAVSDDRELTAFFGGTRATNPGAWAAGVRSH